MSRLYGQKYTRWSDSNVHKHCCTYYTPTSDEEVLSLCRPQLPSPLYSITQQHVPITACSSNYCFCDKQCDRRKKSPSVYKSQSIQRIKCLKCEEPEKIRENLGLHLTGTQVEEALAEDRQAALIQHLDLCTAALEALTQYSQSLQGCELAAYRVLNIGYLLTLPQSYSLNTKSDTPHSTIHLQQVQVQKEGKLIILHDLIKHCSKHLVVSKHFDKLINDHCIKKKDFYTAVKSFKNFLDNCKLSVSQMEKLHAQYETILNDYRQTRCMLDMELPKVINIRMVTLCEGLEKIQKFHDDTVGDNETVMMFKAIKEKLCVNVSDTGRVSHVKHSPKSELCQMCKINPVDHK